MPVPSTMADLSLTAANNSPQGTDPIGNTLDDYLRSIQAILRSTNALAPASIASASTTDIGSAAAESVEITGTTTITSFGTAPAGIRRELRFTGSLTITHSSNIMLPGAKNWQTAPGDVLTFRSLGSGQWIMTGHQSLDASRLTGTLDASRLTGTLDDARLSTNIARLNASQTITGVWTFANTPSFNKGGGTIQLKPGSEDYVYMSLYARSATPEVRSGVIGYTAAGGTELEIRNEISGGPIALRTNNGAISLAGPTVTINGVNVRDASILSSGTLNDARLSSNIPRLNASALITGAWTFDSADNSTPLTVRRSTSQSSQYTGVFGTSAGNFITSYSSTTDTKDLYLRATTNEAGAAGTQEPAVIIRGRANTNIARFSDEGIALGRSTQVTPGAFVRFGHAQQYDGNDGRIGAGLLASGLNIVGVQTVAGQGRRIRIWGSVYLHEGGRLYGEDGTAYLKSNYPSGNVTISTSAPSGGNDGDIWFQVV